MRKICLSLGSNVGDKLAYLKSAVQKIRELEGVEIGEISSIYRTVPIGHVEQDDFLNFVMIIFSDEDIHLLLKKFLAIENDLGRKRIVKWGPRTIDIDILYVDDYECDDKDLTIPHPRMLERAFVLIPMCEIDSEHIINGKNVKYWTSRVSSKGVEIYIDRNNDDTNL